jgi:hypothetical protein
MEVGVKPTSADNGDFSPEDFKTLDAAVYEVLRRKGWNPVPYDGSRHYVDGGVDADLSVSLGRNFTSVFMSCIGDFKILQTIKRGWSTGTIHSYRLLKDGPFLRKRPCMDRIIRSLEKTPTCEEAASRNRSN